MARKPALVWDAWNKEHIKKHNITIEEIDEGYRSKNALKRMGKYGRPEYIAKLNNKRLIVIFISFEKQSGPYVVSARGAGIKERRLYYEKIQ